MGLWSRLIHGKGRTPEELAARLGTDVYELRAFEQNYASFSIPKRSGGQRRIQAPDKPLMVVQKRILRRVLAGLKVHSAVMGFERGRSIVTHARVHAGRPLLLRMDVRRAHQRQCVTGLVINDRPNLPRETRRRLRAIEHHLATGRTATLTENQMAGWRALRQMIEAQSTPG